MLHLIPGVEFLIFVISRLGVKQKYWERDFDSLVTVKNIKGCFILVRSHQQYTSRVRTGART